MTPILDLLLLHARLWDGTGAAPYEADVLVHEGRISAIGPGLVAPDGAQILDVSGATVMPGLVDAHVHLSMDPGAAFRETTPAEHAAAIDAHLRGYLASGVTTILDPAVTPDELVLVRSRLDAGAPGPRFLTLGTPLSPKGGYVAEVIPTFPSVATPEDVARALDLVVSQDTVGVKTTIEPGFAIPVWNVYPDDVRDAIRTGAAERGLTVYTHAMSPKNQRAAIEDLGARVLVHPLSHPDDKFIAFAAERGVYEISTLAILDSFRTGWQPERLDDPLIQLVVPPIEIATARDPEMVKAFEREFIRQALPNTPGRGLIRGVAFGESTLVKRLEHEMAAIHALHAAGVPIVMGSDSGNWPVIPYEFHGPTSIREVELLEMAGLTPAEALSASTIVPARMMGVDGEQGAIKVGMIADLIVVDGDPLANVSALRDLRYVVRAGVARTPQEWAKP